MTDCLICQMCVKSQEPKYARIRTDKLANMPSPFRLQAAIRTSVGRRILPSLWDPREPHVLTGPAQTSAQRSVEPGRLLWPTCLGATLWPAACRRSAPPSVTPPLSGPAHHSVSQVPPAQPVCRLRVTTQLLRQSRGACIWARCLCCSCSLMMPCMVMSRFGTTYIALSNYVWWYSGLNLTRHAECIRCMLAFRC